MIIEQVYVQKLIYSARMQISFTFFYQNYLYKLIWRGDLGLNI
jgi:hypothetical protein